MRGLITKLIIVSLITITSVFSQTTISSDDYTALFSVGTTNIGFADTIATSLNIGQAGGNNNWDFSFLIPHMMTVTSNVDASSTPYAGNFPGANIAIYLDNEFVFDDTTTFFTKSWSYYSNAPSLLIHGSAVENTSVTPNTESTSGIISQHFPPFMEYQFPLEFEKIWSTGDSMSTTTFVESVPVFTSTQSSVKNFFVDAWGTMKMPSGKEVEALRIREQEIVNTFVIPGFPSNSVTVTYFFIARTGESVSVLAKAEDPPNSGEILGSVAWGNDEITEVPVSSEHIPHEFALYQNYPNPFNPSTNIEYSLKSNSKVNLSVFDILGNEVATLVNEQQSSGVYMVTFNGADLSSGVYFIHLSADDFIQVRKMTLVK